jgi:putative oxidoreductase
MRLHHRLKTVFFHPVTGLLLRVYVGAVFVYASMYKINFPAEFAETIASYQLLPHWAVNLVALLIPWLELVGGTLMVLGVRTKAAAAAIGGMLVLFSLAIAITLVRGIPIGCGCFTSLEDPLSWSTLARDLLWLAMTVHVYRYPSALQLESGLFKPLREVDA